MNTENRLYLDLSFYPYLRVNGDQFSKIFTIKNSKNIEISDEFFPAFHRFSHHFHFFSQKY